MVVAVLSAAAAAAAALPTPNAAYRRYQDSDFLALIHFNMGTYAHNGDPCCDASNWDVLAPYAAGKTVDPGTYNPVQLNTTQWFDSVTALGAKHAVLTAKHGCGYLLWPSKVTLPNGAPYGYGVATPGAAIQRDVLKDFVASAEAAGVGYGFYYSIMKNFFLCRSFSGDNSCLGEVLAGQHNLTDAEYLNVTAALAQEVWGNYGNMSRVWIDSPLGNLAELVNQLQPGAAGTPANPIGWCGTEGGHPSSVWAGDVWSLGGGTHGDPNATTWVPIFCDPQLFQAHVWFWEPGLAVRTLGMMIPIYHDIVGRGMTMELAFSIDRDGLVEDTHAAVYKQLGEWVRTCYGSPVAVTSGSGTAFNVTLPAHANVDRVQLREAIANGQRVRRWVVEALVAGAWTQLAAAQAIGRKRIALFDKPLKVDEATTLRLRLPEAVATPDMAEFAVFAPCATE